MSTLLRDILISINNCFEYTVIVKFTFSKSYSVPYFTLQWYFKKVFINKHYIERRHIQFEGVISTDFFQT